MYFEYNIYLATTFKFAHTPKDFLWLSEFPANKVHGFTGKIPAWQKNNAGTEAQMQVLEVIIQVLEVIMQIWKQ